MEQTIVGVDVSKDRLDVHVHPAGERFTVGNDDEGVSALCDRMGSVLPDLIALEATGGMERGAAASLAGAGYPVIVVNPAQVKAFAKALGRQAKTDALDAETIALFCEAVRPEVRPLPDEKTRLLAELMTRRRQLIRMRTGEQQRLKQTQQALLKPSLRRIIEALSRELEALDLDIDGEMRASPLWKAQEELIASVPGVGKTTARTLIAELPELGQLDRRAIASLVGVAPHTRESGRWRGKSFISGGRASVRAILYMAALVATRFNPVLAATYQRLLSVGKPKKLAVIAVARKLLVTLNAMVRDQKSWQHA